MKWARFKVRNQEYYGVVDKGEVAVVKGNIFGDYEITTEKYPLSQVKLLAPVQPGKVIAVGLNYFSHIGEFHKNPRIPEEPVIFMVSPTAIVGPEEEIILPYQEHEIHHEAELTVVIGKEAKDVKVDEVEEYILGYTCGNDVSDRDLQKMDRQWTRAKSFPTFKPLGPYIVSDLNPGELQVKARVNGQVRQNNTTASMIFKVNQLVSFISRIMTLYPGDIILTGTPEGVGSLKSGDVCEIEIAGIGVLRNSVK